MKKGTALATVLLLFMLMLAMPGAAQENDKPLRLPFITPADPNSWMVGQFYGNTVDAYNYQAAWYGAGQGLHFGLDFFAPCGTPVVAAADGDVVHVDASQFGAMPHNVIINHQDLNIATLYGHLLERPIVLEGQPIAAGDVLGFVGDPDGVCESRPHLHFEVRALDYDSAYNPVDYMDAPWNTLATIGPLGDPLFQRDLENPRQWMSYDNQPAVTFNALPFNNYGKTYPPTYALRPPQNPPLYRKFDSPPSANWTTRPLLTEGCCANPLWHDSSSLYFVDGASGELAGLLQASLDGSQIRLGDAPPLYTSPDGTFSLERQGDGVTIMNLATGEAWFAPTDGRPPALSPDNQHLLWDSAEFHLVPGEDYPSVTTFVSDATGENRREIWKQEGGWAMWLDDHKVLIVTPRLDDFNTTLSIYDISSDLQYELGTFAWLRNVSVAPGGGSLLFYLVWQADPSANGVYSLSTDRDHILQKLPWFGGWRWRDAESVYFIPFSIGWYNGDQHVLAYYNLVTGKGGYLTDPATTPFTIMNSDWSVAPDGHKILFRNAVDETTWLLEEQ